MQYDKHLQKTDMANVNNVYSTAKFLMILFLEFNLQRKRANVQTSPTFFQLLQLCLVRY